MVVLGNSSRYRPQHKAVCSVCENLAITEMRESDGHDAGAGGVDFLDV